MIGTELCLDTAADLTFTLSNADRVIVRSVFQLVMTMVDCGSVLMTDRDLDALVALSNRLELETARRCTQ